MLDAGHLVQLAEKLVKSPGMGAPRQAVLRRAVSTAYYAAFHALCRGAAEAFVPANRKKSRVLFYRSLEHRRAKDACRKLGQNPLPPSKKTFFGVLAFSNGLRSFANKFVLLQELRHRCDYDSEYKTTKVQAQEAVDNAAQAIADLDNADGDERSMFLAYLLFGIRQP